MADLHITMLSAALAALVNIWLAVRCGRARLGNKVLHGDGGNVALQRHMRAHANYVEYTPFALILILVLDLADQDGWVLAITALVYFAARIVHPLGMQADYPAKTRQIGIVLTFALLLFWSLWAVLAALGVL
ncbi:MAPEG family protein [Aurantiacibacter rhizosphaerae]|uniref:MAPEG family protein n=1 Tax=Aurantiacibacter rhizosphaerae TaxID=2691582 RepID=A0A844XHE4_9SPHN|nr:MAPEG family protein [Aurantiacibacter rhizosphaerae]MWV29426.1 MAPEG family protein [Aurantiacibacter rhizosphaerae]